MKRRKFIGYGSAGVVLAGATGISFYVCDPSSLKPQEEGPRLSKGAQHLVRLLRERLPELKIDPEALYRFAEIYESRAKKPLSTSRKKASHALTQKFLLSTDFFQSGADESRTLQFAAYYDPYVSPCYNPLRNNQDYAKEIATQKDGKERS